LAVLICLASCGKDSTGSRESTEQRPLSEEEAHLAEFKEFVRKNLPGTAFEQKAAPPHDNVMLTLSCEWDWNRFDLRKPSLKSPYQGIAYGKAVQSGGPKRFGDGSKRYEMIIVFNRDGNDWKCTEPATLAGVPRPSDGTFSEVSYDQGLGRTGRFPEVCEWVAVSCAGKPQPKKECDSAENCLSLAQEEKRENRDPIARVYYESACRYATGTRDMQRVCEKACRETGGKVKKACDSAGLDPDALWDVNPGYGDDGP